MKQFIVVAVSLLSVTTGFAQNEKYQKSMETTLASLETARTSDAWLEAANTFQRIADAEKNQWLPYYYTALSYVNAGYMKSQVNQNPNPAVTDPLADKAEEAINKAEALSKNNSEIFIIKKMIATLRMTADPMNRYQTYGPQAAEALQKAKTLNPENPRVTMLEAQDKFFTPEQFGGSKSEAKILFEETMKKFEKFKPESSIHPQWGLSQVKYYYNQVK